MPQRDFWHRLIVRDEKKDRRRGGRLRQESIDSNRGMVLDLSADGARLLSRCDASGQIEIEFQDHEDKVQVVAEVRWSKRISKKKFEIGLRFVDVPDAVQKKLRKMTMLNSVHRGFHRGEAA